MANQRTNVKLLIAILLLVVSIPARAVWCQNVMIPESNNTGAAVTVQPGSNYLIYYFPPPGASSVGLEFWHHAFPSGVPQNSQYLLAYVNRAEAPARRIFHATNAGPEYDTGYPVNFAMSTFLHPNEWFVVNWLNNTDHPVSGYLVVTLRECY